MGLLARIFGSESRSLNPNTPGYGGEYWPGLGGGSLSGPPVTPETAESLAAVYSAVQLLSETIASLPLRVYRNSADGRELVTDTSLAQLLHGTWNARETAFEAMERMIASVLLTGNAYAVIESDMRGQVTALWPVQPGRVGVYQLDNGRIRYEVTTDSGTRSLTQDEVLHVKHRSTDGVVGRSPITVAREAIGASLAAQNHIASVYRQGARLTGVFKLPGYLQPDSHETLKRELQAMYTGTQNSGRIALLEGGLEYQPISLSPADMQFIETMKLSIGDVARIFRIPPPFLADLSDATYSNINEQSRWLVKHTLRPWLVRIEQAINAALITPASGQYVEFSAEALLRGSTAERFEAYRTGLEWGFISPNEVRERENMNRIDGGDAYRAPMNMEALENAE